MAKKRSLPPPKSSPPPAWIPWLLSGSVLWFGSVFWAFNHKFPVRLEATSELFDDFCQATWSGLSRVVGPDLKSLVLFTLIVLSASCWGAFLLPTDRTGKATSFERAILAHGAGEILLSLILTVMGYFAWGYRRPALWGLLAGLVLGGVFLQRRHLLAAWNAFKTRKTGSPFSFLWLLLAILLAIPFGMCFVPEVFYDSLVYHLGLPQIYINYGHWIDTPHVYFSRFPMLVHMLYVLALGVDGETLAKLLNWAILATGLGGAAALCRRWGYSAAGRWAAAFIAAIPVVQMNNWSTAIDSAMSSFGILALLAYTIWRQQPVQIPIAGEADLRSEQTGLPWLLLASLFAGAVFATKYNGVLFPFAMGILLIGFRKGEPWTVRLGHAAVFAVVVSALMSPWLIRNAVCTGNPVYPLAPHVFPSRGLDLNRVQSEQDLIKGYQPKNPAEILALPWILTMKDISSFDFIGPLTLALLPLGILGFRKASSEMKEGAVLTALYFAGALCFTREIRYLLPGFFLLSLFLAIGVSSARAASRGMGRAWVWIAGLGLIYHLGWILEMVQMTYRPASVLIGDESRLSYEARYHNGLNPCPWENIKPDLDALPSDAKIYILGTEQVARCPRRFIYSSVHDFTPIVLWANAVDSPQSFYAKIKEEGITDILFNYPEAVRLKSYQLFPWTPTGRNNFLQFSKDHLKIAATAAVQDVPHGAMLFQVVEQAPSGSLPLDLSSLYEDPLNLKSHA